MKDIAKKGQRDRISYSLPIWIIERIEAEAEDNEATASATVEAALVDAFKLWDDAGGTKPRQRKTKKR